MAVVDSEKKEVNAKIVYYGPALSGKTTNIHYIYSKLKPQHRGELMTLSTKTHRTLFFDFLPIEVGEVKGFNTRFFLYTVPGQIFYNQIRKAVLKDVDGIVFVADSQRKMKDENIQSYQNLEENLAEMGRSLADIPHILQYNKRDMPDILSTEELHKILNKYNAPFFEAVAIKGIGVLECLTSISKMVLKKLREQPEMAKKKAEGPVEAYGLSDEFIVLKKEEAERLKRETPSAPPPSAPPAQPSPPPQAPPSSPVQATASPTPAPAPQAPAPAVSAEKTGELVLIKWERPQLVGKNTLRLPLIFEDKATGKKYTTTLTIILENLIPRS